MPFQSEAQRRFMFARHPKIAHRWAKEEKSMPVYPSPQKKSMFEYSRKKRGSARGFSGRAIGDSMRGRHGANQPKPRSTEGLRGHDPRSYGKGDGSFATVAKTKPGGGGGEVNYRPGRGRFHSYTQPKDTGQIIYRLNNRRKKRSSHP